MASWGRLLSLNPNIASVELNEEKVLLGRKKSCHASCAGWPDKSTVSSIHVTISHKDGSPVLLDSSSNGTFINGERATKGLETPLKHKDCITLVVPGLTHKSYDSQKTVAYVYEDMNASAQAEDSITSRQEAEAEKEAQAELSLDSSPTSTPERLAKRRSKFSKGGSKMKLVSGKRGVGEYQSKELRRAMSGVAASDAAVEVEPEDFLTQMKTRPGARLLERLQSAIESHDSEWLDRFLAAGGVAAIFGELGVRFKKVRVTQLDKMIQMASVKVIHAIMQEQAGFDAILATPNSLGVLSLGLDSDQVRLKTLVPLLLAAVACFSEKGHQLVLEAMTYFQKSKNERLRFQKLVRSLKQEDDIEYKANCLRLINALISKHGDTEERVAIRQEFRQLGLEGIMDGLRFDGDSDIDREIDGYEEGREEDEREVTVNNVDVTDPVAIASALATQTHGRALQSFREIMQLLFSFDGDSTEGLRQWKLAGSVLKESMASGKKQARLDVGTLRKMKVEAKRGDVVEEDRQAMMAELNDLQNWLKTSKTKHLQEVNDLMDKHRDETVSTKREHEAELVNLRDRLEAMEQKVLEMSVKLPPTTEGEKAESEAAGETQTAGEGESPVFAVAPPPPGPPPPGPPPPPGMGGPPPPPGMPGGSRPSFGDQYAFKPSVQMRKLYWKKVQERQLEGSVWEDLDFAKVQYLQPGELEEIFGARKKDDAKEKEREAAEAAEVDPYENMVDLKRSNNIGIMLSHLKMSPAAIRAAVLAMDEATLSTERVSQLLRNAPTPEEEELLSQFQGDASKDLGKVQQFLYQLVTIPRVRERLELWHFKGTFDESIEDLKFNISTVAQGAKAVLECGSLPRLFELLLAIGNFMNYGPWKAPTKGFHADFLTKVADTRATDNSTTILHYIAGLVKDNDPELLKVPDVLAPVHQASRVPAASLQSDLTKLNDTVKAIKRELTRAEEAAVTEEKDNFRVEMLSFSLHAKKELEVAESLMEETLGFIDGVRKYLVEKESTAAEELLGIVSEFILAYEKCINDNDREQALREQQERLAVRRKEGKAKREAAKAERRRKKEGGVMENLFDNMRTGGMTFRAKRGKGGAEQAAFLEQMRLQAEADMAAEQA